MKDCQRVLVVSYFFPPAGAVSVIRIARSVGYLPQFGWQPVVLSSTDPGVWHEPSLLADLPGSVSIHRLPGVVGKRRAPTRPVESEARVRPISLKTKLKQLVREYLLLPDPMILWVPGAVRAGIQLCRQANVDAIWASGGPWSNHLAAIAIGHIAHLPVVLDFRDVWAPGPPGGSRSHWRQWWDHRLERLSVGQAAAVVVVMESMAEDLRTRHPSFPGQRIICIPNGFDPGQNSGEPASWNGRGPLTLLYTGQMGGFRSARYLLQALQYGLRLGRLAPDQVRVNFVGANSPDSWGKCLGDYIEELGLEGVVEASEPVAYSEVQRLQAQADALIVFKGRGEALPGGALSSKIIDYLGAHRPILALAPQDSAIYNFIVHTGTGICAEPENLDDILSKIEELVQTRGRNLRRNEAEIRSYSRVEQTRRLAELLHELVGGHREKD